jgi:hypothetical protein
MAAAIGTQRMVELCEHYLWVTDTERRDAELRRVLDSSGAVIPPAWRRSETDRGSRWEDSLGSSPQLAPAVAFWSDCSGSVTLPSTPVRASSTLVCPGAPARPVFQSPLFRTSTLEAPPPFLLQRCNALAPDATPPGSPRAAAPGPRTGDTVADRLADEGWRSEVLRRLEENDFSLGWDREQLLEELRNFNPLHPLLCPLHSAYTPGGPALGYSRNASGYYSTFSPSCIGCPIGLAE